LQVFAVKKWFIGVLPIQSYVKNKGANYKTAQISIFYPFLLVYTNFTMKKIDKNEPPVFQNIN
jgi:hypothetical protein